MMTNPALEDAERQADRSRERLGQALDHLKHSVEDQVERVDDLIYRAKAPARFVRENPLYVQGALALLTFVIGVLGGRRYARARKERALRLAPRAYLSTGIDVPDSRVSRAPPL